MAPITRSRRPLSATFAAAALLSLVGCASGLSTLGWVGGTSGFAPGSAAAASVADARPAISSARVRANAGGGTLPVDAPGQAGTTRLHDAVVAEPGTGNTPPKPFGRTFERLKAALKDRPNRAVPPPPPLPRTLPTAAIRLARATANRTATPGNPVSQAAAKPAGRPGKPGAQPRTLAPAPAAPVVVRLPDVTDWPEPSEISGGAATTGSGNAAWYRHRLWTPLLLFAVLLGGLIGLSGRLRRLAGSLVG